MLWRAGLFPGCIAAGLVALYGAASFTEWANDDPRCRVYDLLPGPGFQPSIPPGCESVDWLQVAAWSSAAFVVVMLIGLAAQALWPGWYR